MNIIRVLRTVSLAMGHCPCSFILEVRGLGPMSGVHCRGEEHQAMIAVGRFRGLCCIFTGGCVVCPRASATKFRRYFTLAN